MRAKPLIRVGLVAAGLTLGLAIAEIGARLWPASAGEDLLFNAPDGSPPGLYRHNSQVLMEPVPGFEGVARSLGWEVPVHINALGTRGPAPDRSRPRWIAVGDSFTLSLQVRQEETFEALLGDALAVDVLNAGVDGYSTWQADGRYRMLDDAMGAEAVILLFFLGNDLYDNHRIAEERRNPQAVPPPPPPPDLGRVHRLLLDHSALFGFGRVATRRIFLAPAEKARFREELEIFSASGTTTLDRILPDTIAALRSLRDDALSRDDRLVVALAPPAFALTEAETAKTLGAFDLTDPRPDAPLRAVQAVLGILGVVPCDLTAPLRASSDPVYLRFDGHWSPAGHRVVAEALRDCLDSR